MAVTKVGTGAGVFYQVNGKGKYYSNKADAQAISDANDQFIAGQGTAEAPISGAQQIQNAQYQPTAKELTGAGKYNTFLGPDQLQSMMDQRSDAKKEISDAYRDQQRGLNAQQHQSARAGYESALRASGASQRSALASSLASRGLQGGFAAAQQGGLEASLANQQNQAANNLMMQNVQLQRQGLDNYSNIVNQQEAEARQNLLNRLTLAVGQKGAAGLLSYNPNGGNS